jgi:hypothetical protein
VDVRDAVRDVHPTGIAVAMAIAGAVLFFASILAHELAHAFEALHRGLEVHGITLFLFGGVTEMDARSESPRDEFVIAAVGPYVSLLCGAAFGLLATYATWLFPAGLAQPVADVAGLLGWLNVLLAVFNLVPGAPSTVVGCCGPGCGGRSRTVAVPCGSPPGRARCSGSPSPPSGSGRSPARGPPG